jgi:hypothetical protein
MTEAARDASARCSAFCPPEISETSGRTRLRRRYRRRAPGPPDFHLGAKKTGHPVGNLLLTALTQVTGDVGKAIEQRAAGIGAQWKPTATRSMITCAPSASTPARTCSTTFWCTAERSMASHCAVRAAGIDLSGEPDHCVTPEPRRSSNAISPHPTPRKDSAQFAALATMLARLVDRCALQ